ncbi:Serine/threonine-protein phosphatase 7 long form [Glycine max]|nr:Serine/threonine-protein phosphatase 7 long form [Glycine max]
METFYECKLSMFQNMFRMGKQTENYTSDELSPFIKDKKKYQRKLFLYFGNLMGYLKINASLITALIERWRPETHTFHMRCGECTITLQDVSVLLGLRVDGAPLIGQTNLDWVESCEELLGVRPQEGELQGSVVKLSWLAHHFSQINNHDGNHVCIWRPAVLAFLYREMCSATDYKIKSIGGMCILIQMWAWERCTTLAPNRTPPVIENKTLGHRSLRRGNQHIGNDDLIFLWEPYTTTVMSVLPPICLVGSVAWCAVVQLICFHVVEVLRQFGMQQPIPECPSQSLNIHGLTQKGKQDENRFQLLAPMINQ